MILRLMRADGPPPEAGEPLAFTAVTGGTKADGLNTATLPWDFSRGRSFSAWTRYPLMWVHDLTGVPLGAVDVVLDEDGVTMRALAHFDPDDPDAVKIEKKYRSDVGGLFGFSAQWQDVDADGLPSRRTGKKPVAHQLLEVSAVPVPLDPEAVKDGYHLSGARALRSQLDAVLADDDAGHDEPEAVSPAAPDDTDHAGADEGEGAWEDAAAAMVDVFDRASNDPDAKRRRAYNALKPAYSRLKRVMPEWVEGAELKALNDTNWRALFVAGELEATARAGAELSARNASDLREVLGAMEKACEGIRNLLDRATAPRGQDGENEAGDSARAFETELLLALDAMSRAAPMEA